MRIHEAFDYHPDGYLIRKPFGRRPRKNRLKKNAGWIRQKPKPYIYIQWNKKLWLAHRLIWLWHYDFLPDKIDHKNKNSLDNRIENLRPASDSQNQSNQFPSKRSKSGIRGVSWHKRSKRWFAQVTFRKIRTISYHKYKSDAVKWRIEKAKQILGEYAP